MDQQERSFKATAVTRLTFIIVFLVLATSFGDTNSQKTQGLVLFVLYGIATCYVLSKESRKKYAKRAIIAVLRGARDLILCKKFRDATVAPIEVPTNQIPLK